MIVHMAKKRGGKKKFFVPLGILLLAGGYTAWALTQPLLSIQPKLSLQSTSVAASQVAIDWPSYGQAAVGAPGYGILATHGEQKPVATASTAKVMTALAVLRQRPLHVGEQGPDIVITQADVDNYHDFVAGDGSVVGVALGEHITEYQALQALLLPSANNMAVTLARWAFGSVDAYNTYANAYAKELGLDSMHITDPSGYDLKTVSSARDMTILGTLAMLNPVFAEIVAQPSAKIPIEGTITNYNGMLGKNGNIGIKTGNNDGDKGAFLFASKQRVGDQDITIVGTIMDGPDLYSALKDSDPLATSTAKGFALTTFMSKGQKIGSYVIPDQGTVDAIASADLIFPTWKGMTYTGEAQLTPLSGQTSANTTVGTYTVRNTSSNATSTVPIKLRTSTRNPSVLWRLQHPLGN